MIGMTSPDSTTASHKRIGLVVPSANTVVETVVPMLLGGVDHVTAHYARLKVLRTGLDAEALHQFETAQFRSAIELLADAQVDVIAWAGCSGSWLGPDAEADLKAKVEAATGIEFFSATQAMMEALQVLGPDRISIAAPYQLDMVERIIEVYQAAGFPTVSHAHLDIRSTLEKGRLAPARIRQLVIDAAGPKPGPPIVAPCTNFKAAPFAAQLEDQLGAVVVDSVAAVVWRALRSVGAGPLGGNHGILLSSGGSGDVRN